MEQRKKPQQATLWRTGGKRVSEYRDKRPVVGVAREEMT